MMPEELLNKPPVHVKYTGPLAKAFNKNNSFFSDDFMVSYISGPHGVRGFMAYANSKDRPPFDRHIMLSLETVSEFLSWLSPVE